MTGSLVGITGSLRDPRLGDQAAGQGIIQPWLAVSGGYGTSPDAPPGAANPTNKSIGLSGGLSMVKPFRRTTFILGYSGTGSRGFGELAAANGWYSSNVVSLAVGTLLSPRLTFDVTAFAGASNGGFGITAWGLGANSNGVLESIGVASGSLYGNSGLPPGSSTVNPLQNNLVDNESSTTLAYFADTSASLGVLLNRRTVLSFGGSAFFTRRVGGSYSDANGFAGSASLSTFWTRRFSTDANYSFTRVDFVNSIGYSDINSIAVGGHYLLSARDSLSGSFGVSLLSTQFLATLTLPAEIAQLLGVPVVYVIQNVSEQFYTGALMYNHGFYRGGFGLTCASAVTPGNDLLLLARTETCAVYLSRTLTRRLSVSALGGGSRLNGLAQAGAVYDDLNAGLTLSYRFLGGLAFTGGATYSKNYIKPSTASSSYVSASAGLYWSPVRGLKLF